MSLKLIADGNHFLIDLNNTPLYIACKTFKTTKTYSSLRSVIFNTMYKFKITDNGLYVEKRNTQQYCHIMFKSLNSKTMNIKTMETRIAGGMLGYHLFLYNTKNIIPQHTMSNIMGLTIPCGILTCDIQIIADDTVVCERFYLLKPGTVKDLMSDSVYKKYCTLYDNIEKNSLNN